MGKHVLVEKPLALTSKEAGKMIETAKEKKVVLMVGQSRRFYKAVLESKHYLNKIGVPLNIIAIFNVSILKAPTSWWQDPQKVGEGFIIDLNGPHLVDYITWILDKKPSKVFTLGYQNNSEWKGPDEAVITMKFDNNVIATAYLSFNTSPEINEKIIIGTKGTIRVINDNELWLNDSLVGKFSGEMNYLKGGSNFVRQMEEFINAIRYNKTPLACAEECRKVVEVVEAARKSKVFCSR